MRSILSFAFALTAGAVFAQNFVNGPSAYIQVTGEAAPKAAKMVSAEPINLQGLMMPESAAAYKGKLYVANMGGEPTKSPKKGFFMVSDLDGQNAKMLFKNMLDDPAGFGFFNDNTVILSDSTSVKVLDIKGEKILAELKIEGAGFLNDIVVLNRKTALISDTFAGKVYVVTYNGKTLTAATIKGLDGTVGGVNGLYYANKKLYLMTSTFGGDAKAGDIYTFTFTKGWMEGTLSKPWAGGQIGAGGLDGIYVKGDNVLISDWGKGGGKGAANFYVISESTKKPVLSLGGRTAIADFGVSEDGFIYFPEMTEKRVIKLALPF